MITRHDTYITKLGTQFTFGFELKETNWRVHILDQPSYNGRDENPHTIHVIHDAEDRLICWTGPMPTLGDAKIVAALWSDFTERYIMTGQGFPSI
jgi:hypothetical protein